MQKILEPKKIGDANRGDAAENDVKQDYGSEQENPESFNWDPDPEGVHFRATIEDGDGYVVDGKTRDKEYFISTVKQVLDKLPKTVKGGSSPRSRFLRGGR